MLKRGVVRGAYNFIARPALMPRTLNGVLYLAFGQYKLEVENGQDGVDVLGAIWRYVGAVCWLCGCEADAVVTLNLEITQLVT